MVVLVSPPRRFRLRLCSAAPPRRRCPRGLVVCRSRQGWPPFFAASLLSVGSGWFRILRVSQAGWCPVGPPSARLLHPGLLSPSPFTSPSRFGNSGLLIGRRNTAGRWFRFAVSSALALSFPWARWITMLLCLGPDLFALGPSFQLEQKKKKKRVKSLSGTEVSGFCGISLLLARALHGTVWLQ